MTTNTTNTTTSINESSILKLESLIQEYNLLLTEYQQVNQSYLHSLSVADVSNQWIFIKDHAVWGSQPLSGGPVADASACLNVCIANSSCSGATFDTKNKYCWTSSGENGNLGPSPNQIAIVPESMQYGLALKELNNKMTMVNMEILQLSKQLPLTNNETESQVSSQILHQNYQQLMKDKKMIDEKLAENQSLTNEINETTLSVTHYYYVYFFLFLILLFLIYLLFGHLLFSVTNSNTERNNFMFGGGSSNWRQFIKNVKKIFYS